jgi:hypothetical protein
VPAHAATHVGIAGEVQVLAGAELSYGKVWQSPYLEFSAIIFLESLYTMNRLRNIKFGCYEV